MKKFGFNVAFVAFLGSILESGQVKTELDKITAITDWLTPPTHISCVSWVLPTVTEGLLKNYSQIVHCVLNSPHLCYLLFSLKNSDCLSERGRVV